MSDPEPRAAAWRLARLVRELYSLKRDADLCGPDSYEAEQWQKAHARLEELMKAAADALGVEPGC